MPSILQKRKRNGDAAAKQNNKLRKVSVEAETVPASISRGSEDELEEEEKEEDSDDDMNGASNSHSPSKTLPLSLSQIQSLKSTADLYRSNTFKLQIDALLPNIRPSSSTSSSLTTFLYTLHTFLTSLPDVQGFSPVEGKRRLEDGEALTETDIGTIPKLTTTKTKDKSKAKSRSTREKPGLIPVHVPYPLPHPTPTTQWTVGFKKPQPEGVVLTGSWATGTGVMAKGKCSYSVDIAVEMPDSLFQEKDYLNSRFLHKKAFYLACIASYAYTNDDPRLIKLVLEPVDSSKLSKSGIRIFLIPVVSPTSAFGVACLGSPSAGLGNGKLGKLIPTRGNLRVTASSSNSTTNQQEDGNSLTPLYNTALLRSFTPLPHLLATHEAVNSTSLPASGDEGTSSFRDALALLRVWAGQRGFVGRETCVRGFTHSQGPFWNALVFLVVFGAEPEPSAKGKGSTRRKPLGKGLSSYQLFRGVLDFLASHDWENDPIFVKVDAGRGGHLFPPSSYTSLGGGAIFVDSTSMINLLAGVPVGALKLLSADAQRTLDVLDRNANASALESPTTSNPFPEVFLKDQTDLQTRFDAVVCIDLSTLSPNTSLLHNFSHLRATLDHGSSTLSLLSSIESILTQGLGNRVKALVLCVPRARVHDVRTDVQARSANVIWIGMIYDPKHAFRQVDYGPVPTSNYTSSENPSHEGADGPSTSDAALASFLHLWGPKSSLRRFKDGRIQESVVWEVTSVDEKARIPEMVVGWLMQRWFGLPSASTPTTSFDKIVRLPEKVGRSYTGAAVGTKGALTAFDGVVKAIRELSSADALPLSVMNIHPISDMVRYTSVFSPVPVSSDAGLPLNATYLSPIQFIIEFEKSSRWPDDLGAVQKVKLAFLERIAKGLMQAEAGVTARVVVNPLAEDYAVQLEIITPEGWAFSGQIWVEREGTLLERIVDHGNTGLGMPHVNSQAKQSPTANASSNARLLDSYTRTYIHAPAHHRAIASLSHRFPAFAGTVRLAKRWFGAHWVLSSALGSEDGSTGGFVSEEAVELLCAWVFIVGGNTSSSGEGNEEDSDEENVRRASMSIPGSKERGFACLIRFLKEWNWEEEGGVYVPIASLETNSDSKRQKTRTTGSTGAGVWRISTPVDLEGVLWTRHGPDGVVARRVRALAEATWKHWSGMIYAEGSLGGDVLPMFTHPTDDYDVLIRLDPKVLMRYHQNVVMDEKQLASRRNNSKDSDQLRPGFDPARALYKDLQRIYQDTFRIFHDPFGGDQFGIVWDPSLKKPRPFRVLGGFSSMPMPSELLEANTITKKGKGKDKGKEMVVLNEQGILGEIERLGRGIILGIIVQTRA
ncbi:Nrap protein [Gymnopus androsaceus JB14]|uniref:Nrap protein n=1 Tax=Gymnopus androsaceus JB14 TaxID=1447944 RepID=A0A6A4HJL0_9AGAR|nr:Nrap protein [Gymnopus androsaceus JB14]